MVIETIEKLFLLFTVVKDGLLPDHAVAPAVGPDSRLGDQPPHSVPRYLKEVADSSGVSSVPEEIRQTEIKRIRSYCLLKFAIKENSCFL